MKVEKNNGVIDIEEYIFRFFFLTEELKNLIIEDLQDSKMQYIVIKITNEEAYTIAFELEEESVFDTRLINKIIKKHNLKKENYEYWCFLTTESNNGGMEVPMYILKYYKETGGEFGIEYEFRGDSKINMSKLMYDIEESNNQD